MARLNIFNNFPLNDVALGRLAGASTLHIHYVYIPGSISFNNVNIIFSQGHTSASATISFGLYSLTGSTLSLANSASRAFNTNANGLSWISLATSAVQDITPGDWFFAFLSASSGQNSISYAIHNTLSNNLTNVQLGGPFIRGVLTVGTAALPASIATSDMRKEGNGSSTTNSTHQPYLLLSA